VGLEIGRSDFKNSKIESTVTTTRCIRKRKMFKGFIRLWKSFCKFALSEKKWCWPRQSEVLIYDAAQQEVLNEYLNQWSPEVLHLRGEQYNMPVLLTSFFKRGSRVDAYVDCFMEKVRPRLIITIMDFSLEFYTISKRHPKIKTLAIQIGLRGYYYSVFETFDDLDSEVTNNFFVDYMMMFGSGVGKKYSQCIAGDTVIMGAIKNNMVPKEKSTRRGVISFVSQWRQSSGVKLGETYYSFEDFWTKPDGLVIQCLINYAKIKNRQLMIIPCKYTSNDLRKKEEAYFRELMGSEPEFLCPSGPNSSYQAVDSSEIVVAIDSTLGYESIARGTKTAIFSIRSHFLRDPSRNYGWPGEFPDEGLFWTNNPDPDSFVRILDYLFEVDDARWREDVKASDFSTIMEYDPGNSVLRGTLDRILEDPPF
jgi:surface carbohydrate biosynthesis protein